MEPVSQSPIAEDSHDQYALSNDQLSSSRGRETSLATIAEELTTGYDAANGVQEGRSSTAKANDESTPKPPSQEVHHRRCTKTPGNPDPALTDSVLLLTDQLLTVTKSLYGLADDRFARADQFDVPRVFCTHVRDGVDDDDATDTTAQHLSHLTKQLTVAQNRRELAMAQIVLAENRLRLAHSAMALAEDRVATAERQLESAMEKTRGAR